MSCTGKPLRLLFRRVQISNSTILHNIKIHINSTMKDLPEVEFPHDKLSECHSFYYFFLVLYYVAIPVFNVCFKYFLFSCWAQLSWGECPPLTSSPSSLKLGPLCCVPYVCMIILPYPFFPYATWSHFFYYDKSQNISIYKFKSHLIWKTFLHFISQTQSKLHYGLISIGQFVS